MSNFPSGWFFIQSRCSHGMVMEVADNSLKAVAKIVVSPRKSTNYDNQLWMHDKGYLINKNSGMVIDVQGGQLLNDKPVIQYRRKMIEDAQNQRWFYREDGFIHPQSNANLVLDIRGNWTKPGTVILLYERKLEDNDNQLWDLIPDSSANSLVSTPLDDEKEEYAFSSASYAL